MITAEASGAAVLIGLALLMRLAGAAVRSSALPLSRFAGWQVCALAAWLAAGAAGAFSPVGLAAALGLLLALLDFGERRQPLWTAGEVALVAACGLASFPALTLPRLLAAGALTAAAGLLIDRLAVRLGEAARAAAAGLPLLLWLGYALVFPQSHADLVEEHGLDLEAGLGLSLAVARADRGVPVELDSGAIAWLTTPPGPPPYRPALFFHGSHEDGAWQRGGLFIRRTLVSLGYAVLAVDEPGFGASPSPGPVGDVDAWEPLATSLAAARYLQADPRIGGSILAVGHSMGATRVLRFLRAWPLAAAGVVMGATVMPGADEDRRFYDGFLGDYGLSAEETSPDFVLEVRRRYFNNDRAARELPEGHAPILFVRFANDYQNIIRGREQLFAMFPGRAVQWELASDHQFASARIDGVLTGNWRIMRDLRGALQRFLAGRNPHTGAPLGFIPR